MLETAGATIVVDPGDAEPVRAFLKTHQRPLDYILLTHHHADHTGGVPALRDEFGCQVIGPQGLEDRGLALDRSVSAGETVEISDLSFKVISAAGHTRDHVMFYDDEKRLLFCGDTLFSLGCGRLFEGSPADMWATLKGIRDLPDDTQVYCAHEYTLKNVKFSMDYLKKQNAPAARINFYADLHQKIIFLRSQGRPTVPTTVGFEKEYNLFLRAPDLEAFTDVRNARNSF